jgi:hypothetical protein
LRENSRNSLLTVFSKLSFLCICGGPFKDLRTRTCWTRWLR